MARGLASPAGGGVNVSSAARRVAYHVRRRHDLLVVFLWPCVRFTEAELMADFMFHLGRPMAPRCLVQHYSR